jgi:hypothetical protein
MSALALPTRSQCAEDRVLPNDAFTRPQRAQAAGRISLATKLCSTVHGCQYSRAPERTPGQDKRSAGRFLPTIPYRPDGRPSPARAETAAVVASAKISRIAEIVPPAVIPVAWSILWCVADCSLRTINGNVVVRRLMIAGQEAVAMPMTGVPLVSGRGERNGWQQRQENCT